MPGSVLVIRIGTLPVTCRDCKYKPGEFDWCDVVEDDAPCKKNGRVKFCPECCDQCVRLDCPDGGYL